MFIDWVEDMFIDICLYTFHVVYDIFVSSWYLTMLNFGKDNFLSKMLIGY